MKIIKLFIVLFLCTVAFNVYAAELRLSVDKKVITEADTLFLTIEYTGGDNKTPDLSSLQNDFQIVSNSSSQQIKFINGNMSQSKKWTLGLQPLRQGKITIAPVRIDNIISNSAEVEVKEVSNVAYVPDSRENSNAPYFQIEQTLDNSSPYVQQQITLLVNIYDSLGLQEGNLMIDEESKKDWVIIPLLDQPIVKQEIINYKQMNVETYAFAIFPQKSGDIKEPSFSFDGYYVKNSDFGFPHFNDDISMFGVNFRNVFGQRVPVRMKTKPKVITVKQIPASFSGSYWLPLNNLEVSSSWSAKKGFKVGEAVNRTINLRAYGMTESMLPQIKFPNAVGFNQYPEKPEVSEQVQQGIIVTNASINNVYIPSQSGTLTIPEIKIDWFNTKTNSVETAIIPAETVLVLPNHDLASSATSLLQSTEPQESSKANEQSQQDIPSKEELSKSFDFSFLLKFSIDTYLKILSVIVLIFIFLRLMVLRKRKNFKRNLIIKALRKHDYKKAKEALLYWAEDRFYPADINNFNDIAQLVNNQEFSEGLSSLNKILYSSNSDFFETSKFIEILKKVDKMKKNKRRKAEVLPNLYD